MEIVLATCQTKPQLTSSDATLRTALERRGASVTIAPWDFISPTSVQSRIVCLRSTWDYHQRWSEFHDWVSRFAMQPGTLWNPPETVLWNTDKLYLRDLATAGAALPPTRWFAPGERPDCDALLREWGTPFGVLKPRISATAYETFLISPGERPADSAWTHLDAVGCLFQAFVPEIVTQGEVSLVFIDGNYSHAVRKLPAPGDYRVQSDFGGSYTAVDASPDLRRFGGICACCYYASLGLCARGCRRDEPGSDADGIGIDRTRFVPH